MKAIIWKKYGSPDGLQLQDFEKPTPKDDEILIKIHAASVTTGDCEMHRLDITDLGVRVSRGFTEAL